jgi:hypothetical protein
MNCINYDDGTAKDIGRASIIRVDEFVRSRAEARTRIKVLGGA